MAVSSARRASGAFAVVGAMLMLSACGPAPWDVAGGGGGTPVPARTGSATPAPQPVPNDLSSGSTKRSVSAGSVAATIDYWSTLNMDQWTPTALKPVSLSMATTVTPNDGQQVYLQRATMIAVPASEDETFAPLTSQVDQANVTPGYPVLSPYSYSQTFNVGEVPEGATFVTLQFSYEFLVQTTPTSSEYAKQTGTDTLTVAIAGGGAGD